MYQMPEALLGMDPFQLVKACPLTEGHDPVMGSHDPRKKAKTQYPLAIIVLEAFIINQGDFSIQDGMKQSLVIGLFLFGMGEEQVGFTGNQIGYRYFLYSEKKIAI